MELSDEPLRAKGSEIENFDELDTDKLTVLSTCALGKSVGSEYSAPAKTSRELLLSKVVIRKI